MTELIAIYAFGLAVVCIMAGIIVWKSEDWKSFKG